jgi:hypothetical protein
LTQNSVWPKSKQLTLPILAEMLTERIEKTDFDSARADVASFINDTASIELWSKPFFNEIVLKILTT